MMGKMKILALLLALCSVAQAKHKWLWPVSVAAVVGAAALDAHSSWGRPELNPILGHNFNARSLAVKGGMTGAGISLQFELRRRGVPEERFVWSNFVTAGVLAGAAVHNYRLPR